MLSRNDISLLLIVDIFSQLAKVCENIFITKKFPYNFLNFMHIFRYSSSTSNALKEQSFVDLKPLPREPMSNSEHSLPLPITGKKPKKVKAFGGKSEFFQFILLYFVLISACLCFGLL